MTVMLRLACLSPAVALALTLSLHAQVPPPVTPQPPAAPAVPLPPRPPDLGPHTSLEVQVVIVRTQGDKVLSRLPYSLEVTTGMPESQLNIGTEVPVPVTTFTPGRTAAPKAAAGAGPSGGGQPAPPPGSPPGDPSAPPPQPLQPYSYRSVGTIITCRAAAAEAGQFSLTLSVDDNAVLPRDAASSGSVPDVPAFRSFRARNTLVLRDGQTRTFTAAADRASGEVVRVEVTLRAVKN